MSDDYLIVKSDIPFGSALAYTRGQRIEKDAVERNSWQDYVVSGNTKEGRQIVAEITGEALADDVADRQPDKAPAKTSAKSTTEQKG